MSLTPYLEQFSASRNAAIDELNIAIDASLNSLGKLSRHQLEHLRSLLSAKDAYEFNRIPSDFAQPAIERNIAYFRGLYDISSETLSAFTALGEQQQERVHQSISSLLDNYTKSNTHHEAAIAAVRSAVTAANTVFSNANRAARQVVEITDASVNATTSATARAASAAASQPRKKAA
jgi:phasin family protein